MTGISWDGKLNTDVCPDCGLQQSNPKAPGDTCENPECDSYIQVWRGKARWWNENWG